MYLALVRRLFILLVDEERKAENVRGSSELVVYDLGGLPSIYLKTLYSGYVLASVYREAMKAGMSDGLKTLLIAEEAQNYIFARRPGETPSMAERTVYELRSFGVGVVLVCPDPELLPTAVLKDVGAVVSMGPDSLPRFALERYLFRASLEEAEKTLKELKKAKMIVYHNGNLHFFRRLPKPPKLKPKARPKGDRMGAMAPGGRGRYEHGRSSPTGLPADQHPRSLRSRRRLRSRRSSRSERRPQSRRSRRLSKSRRSQWLKRSRNLL
jgi:hypothetical protein